MNKKQARQLDTFFPPRTRSMQVESESVYETQSLFPYRRLSKASRKGKNYRKRCYSQRVRTSPEQITRV